MKTFKNLLCILSVLCAVSSSNILAQNYTIAATIGVSTTALNRYLAAQYNSAGIPASFSVTYNGVIYTITLTQPEIILTQGNAALRMMLTVTTGTTIVYQFEVDPSINIPAGQITAAQVLVYLTNLPATLNAVTFIPQWVITAVTQEYNSLGFIVYPAQLISQVNTSLFAQSNINIISPYFSLPVGSLIWDDVLFDNFNSTADLKAVNAAYIAAGGSSITGTKELNSITHSYSLSQNYPNPFNPSTVINYSIPKSGLVTIKIYDVLGREVTTLVNEQKSAGNYFVQFSGSHLSSGIYFYRLTAGSFTQTKKLVLLK